MRTQTYTLYLASRHRRTPWYAKALIVAVVGYALSPVDLIPDFIPVLGYLDDLIIVPAGIALALKLVPADVYRECRARAESGQVSTGARWAAASLIVGVWVLALVFLVRWILGLVFR